MQFRLSDVSGLPPYHRRVRILHSHAEYRMAADLRQISAVWQPLYDQRYCRPDSGQQHLHSPQADRSHDLFLRLPS